MAFAIPVWQIPSIPIVGSDDTFPVRRIYCVGRNYAAHAREMGHDPDREPPFFFMKPADAVVPSGSTIPYPQATSDLHHEIEMVVALKSGGTDISVERANECVFGYAVGLDLTRRDLQGEAKKMGRPWCMGKGFDRGAPCAPIHRVEDTGLIEAADIWLTVNGEMRQTSNTNALIWSVPETISYLSGLVELAAGDLIYSGTPDGVAAIGRGDVLHGQVAGLTDLHITIAE
jgi:fumarylpyruvate hydrolase